MTQMTFATAKGFEVHGRATRKAEFLARMEALVPWAEFCALSEAGLDREQGRDHRWWRVLLNVAEMSDNFRKTHVVPAKAGTQRLPSKDTGFPRSVVTERERRYTGFGRHAYS